VDPRLERRRSPIQGTGLFATAPIRRGEIVTIWGGTLFSDDELHAGIARPMSCVPIIDGLHLGSFKDQPESLDEFMNHSCDPNLWLQDEVTLVAMRDIAEGEEVTIDYALWETDPGWRMKCLCHSPRCRDWISGDDWRRSDVRQRYAGHFSPYVARRIRLVGAARDAA
jgi:hypothetical protein